MPKSGSRNWVSRMLDPPSAGGFPIEYVFVPKNEQQQQYQQEQPNANESLSNSMDRSDMYSPVSAAKARARTTRSTPATPDRSHAGSHTDNHTRRNIQGTPTRSRNRDDSSAAGGSPSSQMQTPTRMQTLGRGEVRAESHHDGHDRTNWTDLSHVALCGDDTSATDIQIQLHQQQHQQHQHSQQNDEMATIQSNDRSFPITPTRSLAITQAQIQSLPKVQVRLRYPEQTQAEAHVEEQAQKGTHAKTLSQEGSKSPYLNLLLLVIIFVIFMSIQFRKPHGRLHLLALLCVKLLGAVLLGCIMIIPDEDFQFSTIRDVKFTRRLKLFLVYVLAFFYVMDVGYEAYIRIIYLPLSHRCEKPSAYVEQQTRGLGVPLFDTMQYLEPNQVDTLADTGIAAASAATTMMTTSKTEDPAIAASDGPTAHERNGESIQPFQADSSKSNQMEPKKSDRTIASVADDSSSAIPDDLSIGISADSDAGTTVTPASTLSSLWDNLSSSVGMSATADADADANAMTAKSDNAASSQDDQEESATEASSLSSKWGRFFANLFSKAPTDEDTELSKKTKGTDSEQGCVFHYCIPPYAIGV